MTLKIIGFLLSAIPVSIDQYLFSSYLPHVYCDSVYQCYRCNESCALTSSSNCSVTEAEAMLMEIKVGSTSY